MIVGLHGRMGSGKDTVYELMREFHDGVVERRAFADPLKISAARALGFVGGNESAIAYCNMLKEKGALTIWQGDDALNEISGRQFLQNYGTEAHRNVFGKDFWVDASLPQWDGMGHTESGIFHNDPDNDYVIFTDVRFENEAERIRQWGGEIWEIIRWEDKPDAHVSEVRLPTRLIDATIDNRGTYDDLRNVVKAILDVQLARRDRIHLERIR